MSSKVVVSGGGGISSPWLIYEAVCLIPPPRVQGPCSLSLSALQQRRRDGGGDGGNVETTGREYLIAPAIFPTFLHALPYTSTLCRYVSYIQLKRHTQLVLQVEYCETN